MTDLLTLAHTGSKNIMKARRQILFLQSDITKILGVILLAVFALLFSNPEAQAQPIIYLVRHAEKLPDWPKGALSDFQPLSAEGILRARKLAALFQETSLKAIYSSLTTRTLHTAFPLSQKLHLPIKFAKACQDTAAIAAFLSDLAAQYADDDAVLLVSHSNIIPYLLLAMGLPADCHKEMGFTRSPHHSWIVVEGYDKIWKVEKNQDGRKECSRFQTIPF
ncbi:MAG: histidine phosphatase family protein [bacterium]